MRRHYLVQWRSGAFLDHDIVRASDGAIVSSTAAWAERGLDTEKLLDEMERLACENEKLREGRDEKLRAAERKLESLEAQLVAKAAEAQGQGSFAWPAIQY